MGLLVSSARVALSTTAGLGSPELSPRQKEGQKAPRKAKVAGAVLRGDTAWRCSGGWVREKGNRSPIGPVCWPELEG